MLVGLRDFQDDKGDVILKYNADEARSLKAYGELPESAKINETTGDGAASHARWQCLDTLGFDARNDRGARSQAKATAKMTFRLSLPKRPKTSKSISRHFEQKDIHTQTHAC